MKVGTVSQLWRYPVKSMGGERLRAADLTWRGIPGDRGWAVYDEAGRGVTNAKRLASLRTCRVRYRSEPVAGAASPVVEITLPDGARVLSDSADVADHVSTLVGRPVSLVRENRHTAGVYARVVAEGELREDDEVALLD